MALKFILRKPNLILLLVILISIASLPFVMKVKPKNTIEGLLNKLREDAKARCVKKGVLSEEKKSAEVEKKSEQKDNK